MWEVQIRNLGGPNYMRGGRVVDDEGREIPGGGKGYRYACLLSLRSWSRCPIARLMLSSRERAHVADGTSLWAVTDRLSFLKILRPGTTTSRGQRTL